MRYKTVRIGDIAHINRESYGRSDKWMTLNTLIQVA